MDKECLYRFFENRASVDEQRRILDWLDEDPAHRREMLAERKLFDAMLIVGEPAPAKRAGRRFALPRWTREAIRYAAVVLLVVGTGGFFVSRAYDELTAGANTISVPAGQRVNVVLPDGTKVCMNALSELTYPSAFAGKQRKVRLTGEAFFEVTHDADHPFVVETYACDVEVLGTTFDVEARPATSEFVTSLVEGSVKVSDRNDPQSRVLLNPSEQVHYVNRRLVVGKIPEYEGFLWRDGVIAFRDASFMELIRLFEKYYGVHIETCRTDISRTLVTGKIRISEGVDHALWVLQQSADFRYVRNDAKDMILIK